MSNKVTETAFDRLPKWAKDEITSLRSYVKSLESKMSQYNGTEDTNVFIQELLSERPLPKDASIAFKTGYNNTDEVRVRIMKDGIVEVNCQSRMGKDTIILPCASNAFYITFADL